MCSRHRADGEVYGSVATRSRSGRCNHARSSCVRHGSPGQRAVNRNVDQRHGDEIRPRYLVWHPTDHIHWELARPAPSGGAGEGARFRIVEVFVARPEFSVDTTETVEKLDRTGIRLVHRIAGVPVIRLEHTWSTGRGRTHYVSVLDVGARSRLFAPVNRY